MDIAKLRVSEQKIEQGVWLDYDGSEFLVASSRSHRYRRAVERAHRRYESTIRRKALSSDESDRIMHAIHAETILLDWRGVTEDGKPVAYSKEACMRLLASVPEFYDWLVEVAANVEVFRDADTEATDAADDSGEVDEDETGKES